MYYKHICKHEYAYTSYMHNIYIDSNLKKIRQKLTVLIKKTLVAFTKSEDNPRGAS